MRTILMVGEHGEKCGAQVFVVGGLIRDLLLGRVESSYDLDLSIEGDALDFVARFPASELAECKVFQRARTATLRLQTAPELLVDIVTARREEYERPGAYPRVRAADITSDLLRRDFSINAIACCAADCVTWLRDGVRPDSLLDPTGGVSDLETHTIRVLHEKSFSDDPTRIIRALRYNAKIRGVFDIQTEQLLVNAVRDSALSWASPARVAREIVRVCDTPSWDPLFWQMLESFECLQGWDHIAHPDRVFLILPLIRELSLQQPDFRYVYCLVAILKGARDPQLLCQELQIPRSLKRLLVAAAGDAEILKTELGTLLQSHKHSGRSIWKV